VEQECPHNRLGTAIAPLSCTGGLKNGVEPTVLGSLAPGKGFHNTVGPLLFCTIEGGVRRTNRPWTGDMSTRRVDLNSDVGESFGAYTIGHDDRLLSSVTSANIACGYHAGDPSVMRATVRQAIEHAVALGAHPGFPDLVGFGRRRLSASPAEVEDLVLYQIGALSGIVLAEGGRLTHVKPHGALYNMASEERPVANAVARAVKAFDGSLVLFGLSGSRLLEAGQAEGLTVASEVFADRTYQANGALVSRTTLGAVIDDVASVVERAIDMVATGTVTPVGGEPFTVRADTICVHGDTPGAVELAAGLRAGLEAAGIGVVAVARAKPAGQTQ